MAAKEVVDSMSQDMDKSIQSLKGDFVKVRTGRASTALSRAGACRLLRFKRSAESDRKRHDSRCTYDSSRSLGSGHDRRDRESDSCFEYRPDSSERRQSRSHSSSSIDRRAPQRHGEARLRRWREETKVAVRTHRRDANEKVKALEKAKTLTEDDAKKAGELIQKKTDEKIAEVDKVIAAKEKEILTI